MGWWTIQTIQTIHLATVIRKGWGFAWFVPFRSFLFEFVFGPWRCHFSGTTCSTYTLCLRIWRSWRSWRTWHTWWTSGWTSGFPKPSNPGFNARHARHAGHAGPAGPAGSRTWPRATRFASWTFRAELFWRHALNSGRANCNYCIYILQLQDVASETFSNMVKTQDWQACKTDFSDPFSACTSQRLDKIRCSSTSRAFRCRRPVFHD